MVVFCCWCWFWCFILFWRFIFLFSGRLFCVWWFLFGCFSWSCFDVSCLFFFYFINFAPDKCRKCVLSCFVITFHVPILAWLLLLSCWIFCVTQCSWSSFFVGGKITFVLKQTEKERECVKKTKLGDHNCITNYFFFFNFFKALFFDNTIWW